MFLMIQNPGVAPVEGFTLLGVSTTRDCGVDGTIGQFGSGNKHAINVLLRAGLKVTVYCGKTRLEFVTRDDEVDDGITRKKVQRVVCKLGGTSSRTLDLGWVLDFGAIDWTYVSMALREFVSNAIDRTLREENGQFVSAIQDGRLAVTLVDDSKVKAKDGYTRVFVEMDESVRQYVDDLSKWFLHFSDDPSQVKKCFLPKADRNPSDRKTAVIYREGVFVREIQDYEKESVYDYNFKAGELPIDECRNSSDYAIRMAVSRLYRRATSEELQPVFKALTGVKPVFEENLDPTYICPSWDTPKPEQKAAWQAAWQAVGADTVMCGPLATTTDFVQRKGYATTTVRSDALVDAAQRFGIVTDGVVLSEAEKNGHEKLPATPAAQAAVDQVWDWLTACDLTNGREKPPVGCFRNVMNAGRVTLGFCDDEGVFLEEAHASGVTKMVLKTTLEEVAHWVTKATDNSRDLQDFVFRLAVEALTCKDACTVAA